MRSDLEDWELDNSCLLRWCSLGSGIEEAWRQELLSATTRELPGAGRDTSRWSALAFRRDLLAVLASKPPHGGLDLPDGVPDWKSFDFCLTRAVRLLEGRCARAAEGLPLNRVHGPWEGGSQVDGHNPSGREMEHCQKALAPVGVVWNVRGACSTPGGDCNTAKILQLAGVLHKYGATFAVISDPQLAPGMAWPVWTGFEFYGAQMQSPASVALLVLTEARNSCVVLNGYGDARAIWFQMVVASPSDGETKYLGLAAYAPPPNHLPAERYAFWRLRFQELSLLRLKPEFAHAPFFLAGDLNVHVPYMSSKDASLTRQVDREIWLLLMSQEGFALQELNQPGVPTHSSGTTLDFVLHNGAPGLVLGVGRVGEEELDSDHSCLVLSLSGSITKLQETLDIISLKWHRGAEWTTALNTVQSALLFVAGWAGLLMRSNTLRTWVQEGSKRALRQKLVDIAVWWRSALLVMAGHLHGLTKLCLPSEKNHVKKDRQLLRNLFQDSAIADPLLDTLVAEEAQDQFDSLASLKHLVLLRDSLASGRNQAQRLLSALIRPPEKLQLALRDDEGDVLPLSEALRLLVNNVEERAQGSHSGDVLFTRKVQQEIKTIRARALLLTACEVGDPSSLTEVARTCEQMASNKASVALPRANLQRGNEAGIVVAWALSCLISVCCVTPSSWYREITPIRKRGPKIVSDVNCLRPISYVGDLESLVDALWLRRNKTSLEVYCGGEQHGGRSDATLITLAILVVAQLRLAVNLPTLITKADLYQGYDLAWRQGTLIHLARAGIAGRDWLQQDAAFSSDNFRVRLGILVGPIRQLFNFSIAQGKRTAVHLFNILARGLPDQLNQACVGVGIGHSFQDVREAMAHCSTWYGCAEALSECANPPSLSGGEAARVVNQSCQATASDRLVALDVLAPAKCLCFQFVDDSFTLQSTVAGMNKACAAAEDFTKIWRHKFAGGTKGSVLLPVGCSLPPGAIYECVGGSPPKVVNSMKILGSLIDKDLALDDALNVGCATLLDQARSLNNQTRQLGLGINVAVDEVHTRVLPSALFGIEVVASCKIGWKQVCLKLNRTFYQMAKELLGVPSLSLGQGGSARLFAELGIGMRLATRVAIRIALCRARALCLSPELAAAHPFRVAMSQVGSNWLHHAECVSATQLSLSTDFIDDGPWLPLLQTQCGQAAVLSWKHKVVVPAALLKERQWFAAQAQLWENSHSEARFGERCAKPLFLGLLPRLVWHSGKWRYLRAWAIARLTGCFPLAVWGAWLGVPQVVPQCPGCMEIGAHLQHVLECPGLAALHPKTPIFPWVLQDTADPVELEMKVLYVGRIAKLVVNMC